MHQTFVRIKSHYKESESGILSAGKRQYGIDPYAWDGLIDMSPIETYVWNDARDIGLVLYPQYPVAGFFVDFANPVAKIAIECDGKEFHKDKAKDAVRQSAIEKHGWTVYRFTGAQCFNGWAHEVLKAIGSFYDLTPRIVSIDDAMMTMTEHAFRQSREMAA